MGIAVGGERKKRLNRRWNDDQLERCQYYHYIVDSGGRGGREGRSGSFECDHGRNGRK